jgi:hypothetical protein
MKSSIVLIAATLALPSACAAPPQVACRAGSPEVTATLYFGRSLKGGGEIDDAAWRDFLAQEVTPRFPDGLTVLDANGQWRQRESGRIISERSTIVVIVTDPTPKAEESLQAIRAAYQSRFSQESVGLVTEPDCASF